MGTSDVAAAEGLAGGTHTGLGAGVDWYGHLDM